MATSNRNDGHGDKRSGSRHRQSHRGGKRTGDPSGWPRQISCLKFGQQIARVGTRVYLIIEPLHTSRDFPHHFVKLFADSSAKEPSDRPDQNKSYQHYNGQTGSIANSEFIRQESCNRAHANGEDKGAKQN